MIEFIFLLVICLITSIIIEQSIAPDFDIGVGTHINITSGSNSMSSSIIELYFGFACKIVKKTMIWEQKFILAYCYQISK